MHVAWGTYAKPAHAASQPRESANVVRLLESSRRENHPFRVSHGRNMYYGSFVYFDMLTGIPSKWISLHHVCCMSGFNCEAGIRNCTLFAYGCLS